MTDAIRDYLDAAMDLLSDVPNLPAYKPDTVPNTPQTRPPLYAVVFPDVGVDGGRRLADNPSDQRWHFAVLHVGKTVSECAWAVEKARGALRGVQLTEDCTPLRQSSASNIRPDNSLTPPLYTATDVWSFASVN